MDTSTPSTTTTDSAHRMGGWLGAGDQTYIFWPLALITLLILALVAGGILWAWRTGQFKGVEQVARRMLEQDEKL